MPVKTVMIAEDQGIISLDLKLFLKSNNIDSFIVKDGEELLQQFEIKKPDLIIADLNIGGEISGKEALREINKNNFTPIILISGSSRSKVEEFANTLSGCLYLTKPFEKSELLASVIKLLK